MDATGFSVQNRRKNRFCFARRRRDLGSFGCKVVEIGHRMIGSGELSETSALRNNVGLVVIYGESFEHGFDFLCVFIRRISLDRNLKKKYRQG